MKYIYAVLSITLFICFIPVLSPFVAGLIANMAGCDLNEGGTTVCMIAGVDFGETLYFAFMLHWLGLLTLPFAALALLALILTGIIDFIRRRYRRA